MAFLTLYYILASITPCHLTDIAEVILVIVAEGETFSYRHFIIVVHRGCLAVSLLELVLVYHSVP